MDTCFSCCKQAYTNELENKVSRLEEENEKLRKQRASSSFLFSRLFFFPLFENFVSMNWVLVSSMTIELQFFLFIKKDNYSVSFTQPQLCILSQF